MTTSERQLFRDYLKSRRLRLTGERECIIEEVFATHEHFEAEELAARLRNRGVSKATIYRTLPLLVSCGLLRQVIYGEKHGHYEHVHQEEEGHDHLICVGCGKVIEFRHDCMEALKSSIKEQFTFEPHRVVLEVSGLCADCGGKKR